MDDWRTRGACRRLDNPDLMYPDNNGDAITAAKTVCARCPVQNQCLQHALDTGETWGVWGGFTSAERAHHKVGKPIRWCPRCRTYTVGRQPRCSTCGPRIYNTVAAHADSIAEWASQGWNDRRIADVLGVSVEGVRHARHRWQIPSGGRSGRQRRPCGTEAAKRRHARRNDPPCALCRWAGTPQPSAASAT